ncbi:2,4-dienoyl-CoA reductase-like NADH-dependent reductase (Old Yellow Enzyme family) [Massilia sp. MP_M2]
MSFSEAAAIANDAGFDDIEVFEAGGAFRGWICRA